ncbi:hypothetical protein IE53DRAFT_391234 [Violaceomyces palustris]|uniref:Uncharacterized protein n=1 Tax=Violaceomyces palustris TaxID=1673888 RepID=A0ACD0NLC4_9BASI|nr:hypothetical protein IE53DRAFT_391234 [Violaceomyces palustris]
MIDNQPHSQTRERNHGRRQRGAALFVMGSTIYLARQIGKRGRRYAREKPCTA